MLVFIIFVSNDVVIMWTIFLTLGLDAMGLSNYVAEVRAASEGAKVELKDRRMLSASHRFKKHDSAELQRLMEEQERIFELVSYSITFRYSKCHFSML